MHAGYHARQAPFSVRRGAMATRTPPGLARSTRERNEHAHAEGEDDVVHDVLVADERFLQDVIAQVGPEREPLAEEELRPEAGAPGEAARGRVVGHAGAEGEVEIEATDAAPHPAQLAVGERPDEVTEVEVPGL